MSKALIAIALLLAISSLAWASVCPGNCSGHGFCQINGICVCSSEWVGVDCSIPVKPLNFDQPIHGSVAQGAWHYYTYVLPANSGHRLHLSINPPSVPSADADIYVKKSMLPTRTSYEWAHTGTGSNSTLIIPPQSTVSTFYVGVYGYTWVLDYSLTLIRAGTVCPNDCSGHGRCETNGRCTCNEGWHGHSCNTTVPLAPTGRVTTTIERASWLYYYINIPQGTVNVNVSVVQSGTTGDVDLYIKRGSVPTFIEFDYVDTAVHGTFTLTIPGPVVGQQYYLGFYGFTQTTYTWEVIFSNSHDGNGCQNQCSGPTHGTCQSNRVCQCGPGYTGPGCADMNRALTLGETVTGLVEANEWNYYYIRPNTAADLTIEVNHTTGQDCDVYVKRNGKPSRFDFTYRDISYRLNTQLIVPTPNQDDWHIGVMGYNYCQYTLTTKTSALGSCPAACTANGGHCVGTSSACVCGSPLKGGPDCSQNVIPITLSSSNPSSSVHGEVKANEWVFYRVNGPASAFVALLHENVAARAGVLWLYVSSQSTPTLQDFDWSDTSTGSNTHRVAIEMGTFASDAHFYVGVYGSPYATGPQGHKFPFDLATWVAPFK